MTTNISAGSAQIYQFPPRGRFALNARDDSRTADLEATQAVRVVASGWYHDAAIQEADRSRSN
jgi:Protein of unknown function (DUF2735)